MPNTDQVRSLFAQLSIFALVAAVWFAGVTIWMIRRARRREQLQRRLQFTGHEGREKILRLWHDGQPTEAVVRDDGDLPLMRRLQLLGEDAGWTTPMPALLSIVLLAALACGTIIYVILGNIPLAGATVLVVLFGFKGYMEFRITKQTALFESQLVDALDLGVRSLRAGHPLSGAFQLIAHEVAAPINAVFARIVEQEAMGISIQEGLRHVADHTRSADMKIFATSVVIQLRSGGNLADMMDRVAWVLRDRMRLNRRARALTAEAQLSKWILVGLPVVLFLALNVLNRDYMSMFFTTFAGSVMMAAAIVSLILGAWVMSRMSTIKY